MRLTLCSSWMFSLAFVAHSRGQTPIPHADGTPIVINASVRELETRLVVEARPSLVLGGGSAKEARFDVRNPFAIAKRLSSGGFVAADFQALKYFDERGRFLRTIGNSEVESRSFGQLRDVCVMPGDTIVAISYNRRNISSFDRDGHFLESRELPGYVWSDACFADGTILVRLPPARAESSADELDSRTLVRVRPNGSMVGAPMSYTTRRLPPDTPLIENVAAGREGFFVGNGSEPQFAEFALSGRLVRFVRWLPPTGDVGPKFGLIKTDPAGRAWVQMRLSSDRDEWVVFDRAGRLYAKVCSRPWAMGV